MNYRILTGSHAYNLENQGSDLDVLEIVFQTPQQVFCGEKVEEYNKKEDFYDITVWSFDKFVKLLRKQNSLICFEALFSQQFQIASKDYDFMKPFIDNRYKLFGKKFQLHLVKSAHQMFLKSNSNQKVYAEVLKRLYLADYLFTSMKLGLYILPDDKIEILRNIRENEQYFLMHERSIKSRIEEFIYQMDLLLEPVEDDSDKVDELIDVLVLQLYQEYK